MSYFAIKYPCNPWFKKQLRNKNRKFRKKNLTHIQQQNQDYETRKGIQNKPLTANFDLKRLGATLRRSRRLPVYFSFLPSFHIFVFLDSGGRVSSPDAGGTQPLALWSPGDGRFQAVHVVAAIASIAQQCVALEKRTEHFF